MVVDGIALAPSFEYLPPSFGEDSEHASILRFVHFHRAHFGGGPIELGDTGRTALQVVDMLIGEGATRIVVVSAHSDPFGAAALREAAAFREVPWTDSVALPVWRKLSHAPAEERSPGSPWAVRYGLHRDSGVAAVLGRARSECPSLVPWVEAVRRFAELGVHPLAEVFAGNDLFARNGNYLENLKP